MKAKIKIKKEIAKGTLYLEFDLLGKEIPFKPGQYFFITLKEGGQRHFSIVNTPNQKGILSMATRIREESGFKKYLAGLSEGSEVEIGAVTGDFILPETNKPLVFIAGGIGITPFYSMIKYVDEEGLDKDITLIYSNRDRESLAFLEELEKISAGNGKIKLILTMTDDLGWEGEKRMIDSKFIKDYFPEVNSNFYMVAGPPKMVEAVYNALVSAGAEKGNIKIENFSGY